MANLKTLSDAPWRIVSVNKSQNKARLTEWSITAEARIPEKSALTISERARGIVSTGADGLAVRVTNVSYRPTVAELETANINLRNKIYQMAATENKAISTALNGLFQIADISFDSDFYGLDLTRNRRAEAAYTNTISVGVARIMSTSDGEEISAGGDFNVSHHVGLSATVTFRSAL